MRKTLPHLAFLILVTALLWSPMFQTTTAQPAGWSGNNELAFLLEVDGVSAADSDLSSPIPVNLSEDLSISLDIQTGENLTVHSGLFTMEYMGIPFVNNPFPLGIPLPSGYSASLLNGTIPLATLFGASGLDLLSGTITGRFTFTYSLLSTPTDNKTVSDHFVLQIGPQGAAALMSVNGLITVGFAVMAVFSLLLALDEFQRGILAARKMRKGTDVFPSAVVLRRKPKKSGEKVSKDDLVSMVIKEGVSEDIAKRAPKAMDIVKPKSKVPVGKLSKALKLKRDDGGALAAAMTKIGAFQTKSVKVPLKKIAFSGLTLSGIYWSIVQLMSGAVPTWVDILLFATVGLVVSVFIGYLMNFLARVPAMGYE
ncbi:MAG: hypothetical protein EAX95_01800 [Candidatus Thorarchaeota archaeon]|nr:hypothetical protein [Candidatus Thorarchaeota archaeon]